MEKVPFDCFVSGHDICLPSFAEWGKIQRVDQYAFICAKVPTFDINSIMHTLVKSFHKTSKRLGRHESGYQS